VFTVSVVVVVGVIEGAASEQVPPGMGLVDKNAQLKLTVPVKPLRGLMPIEVLPDAPGDAMAIEFGLGTTPKSGVPLLTVTVRGEDVEAE